MQRYEAMRKGKSSGKAIIAAARKMAVIIWHMLTEDVEFDIAKMVDLKLAKKSEVMSNSAALARTALLERSENLIATKTGNKGEKKIGVAKEKIRKVG